MYFYENSQNIITVSKFNPTILVTAGLYRHLVEHRVTNTPSLTACTGFCN